MFPLDPTPPPERVPNALHPDPEHDTCVLLLPMLEIQLGPWQPFTQFDPEQVLLPQLFPIQTGGPQFDPEQATVFTPLVSNSQLDPEQLPFCTPLNLPSHVAHRTNFPILAVGPPCTWRTGRVPNKTIDTWPCKSTETFYKLWNTVHETTYRTATKHKYLQTFPQTTYYYPWLKKSKYF